MRREQIFKICLNHVLSKEINYKKKDDKSWLFFASDYSEGTVETFQFCIRFKNTEIAKEFKESIDRALEGKLVTPESIEGASDSTNDAKELERLKLPGNFYDYKTAKECPGCVGCKSDEFVFPAYNNTSTENDEDPNPIPLEHPKLRMPLPTTPKSTKIVSFQLNYENKENEKIKALFGGSPEKKSDSAANIFALKKSPETTNIFTQQNKTVFGESTNIFGTPGGSIFSPKLNTVPVSTPSTADSNKSEVTTIFGGSSNKLSSATTPNEGGNIFGGKSTFSFGSGSNIFGGGLSNKDSGESKSVFGGAPTFGSGSSTFSFATAAKELKNGDNTPFKNTSNLPTFTNLAGASSTEKEKENGDKSPPNIPTTVQDKEQQETSDSAAVPSFLKKDISNTIDFAALASTAAPESTFLNANSDKPSGFFGLTIKEDAFSRFAKQQQNPDESNDGDHDESTGNDNYDPHYDPIISLPDEIKVCTGEEDETKIYGERAKLFRYDTNTREWKERGKKRFN